MSSDSLEFENMTVAQFEERLPELFANGNGRVSDDPNVQRFLSENPTCAALVQDLEYIAETARQLLEPDEEEPSPDVWYNIEHRLKIAAAGDDSK